MTIEEMKAIKKEYGLSNEMVARETGIPLSTVGKVLAGLTRYPRKKTVDTLTEYFRKLKAGNQAPDGSAQFHNIYEQSEILSHNAFHERPIDYAYAEQPEHLVTIEERDRLPDDRRTELIDGVLYDMAGAGLAHQTIVQGIFAGLKNCIDRYKLSCKAFVSPADIVLEVSPATVVEPDVFVICDPKKIKDGKYYGAPKIVVEVMSPSSRKMDSIIKLNKYMSSGVEEYWMVDPEKETVTVHDFRYYLKPNPQGGRGQVAVHTYPFSDRIPVLSSDGLCEIDFSRIKKELEWFAS